MSRALTGLSVVPLHRRPDPEIVFRSDRPGAALLDGWSDHGAWQFLLPWPEETRTLPWTRASEWKDFIRDLECETVTETHDALPFSGGWVGYLSYEATATEEAVRPRDERP
ncbi:MAG: hypothetical protein ABI779_23845, partial [Acidobacteriota bacterium]